MNALTEAQVLDAEERLRLAMMASDVAVLNVLLADDLLFTNHLGHLLSKHADLAAHEQHLLAIADLRAAATSACAAVTEASVPSSAA